MLARAVHLVETASALIVRSSRVASAEAQRGAVLAGLLAGAAFVACCGFVALLGGVCALIARELGWSWALIAMGGGVTLLFGGAAASAFVPRWRAVARKRRIAEMQAERARRRLQRRRPPARAPAAPSRSATSGRPATPRFDPVAAAADVAAREPLLTGSAAFALVSLLGLRRTNEAMRHAVEVMRSAQALRDASRASVWYSPRSAASR